MSTRGRWLIPVIWVVLVALALLLVPGEYARGLTLIISASVLSFLIAWFQLPLIVEQRFLRTGPEAPAGVKTTGAPVKWLVESPHSGGLGLAETPAFIQEIERRVTGQIEAGKQVTIEYVLRYPTYWFGLTPFRLRLGLGVEDAIERLLGALEKGRNDLKGSITFPSVDERPCITAELLVPPDAAKVHEGLLKQTKQVDPNQATVFDFLVTPSTAEDLMIGVRVMHRVSVPKESRSKTITKTTATSLVPASAGGQVGTTGTDGDSTGAGEIVKEEYVLTWEPVDLELVTVWITVKVRSLFRLSTGATTIVRAALSPVAVLGVLWFVAQQNAGVNAYLVVTALVGAAGIVLPQPLADALKGKPSQSAEGASPTLA